MPKWFRTTLDMAAAVAIVMLAKAAVAEPFYVPSASMEPTLLIGDHPIAGKYTYGYSKFSSPIGLMPDFNGRVLQREPARGDIIVFKLPRDTSVNYVKRLIGLPGDHIRMQGGRLYINGVLVPRRDDGFYTAEFGGQPVRVRRYIHAAFARLEGVTGPSPALTSLRAELGRMEKSYA